MVAYSGSLAKGDVLNATVWSCCPDQQVFLKENLEAGFTQDSPSPISARLSKGHEAFPSWAVCLSSAFCSGHSLAVTAGRTRI